MKRLNENVSETTANKKRKHFQRLFTRRLACGKLSGHLCAFSSQILFEAIVGTSFTGDIAIDDFQFYGDCCGGTLVVCDHYLFLHAHNLLMVVTHSLSSRSYSFSSSYKCSQFANCNLNSAVLSLFALATTAAKRKFKHMFSPVCFICYMLATLAP